MKKLLHKSTAELLDELGVAVMSDDIEAIERIMTALDSKPKEDARVFEIVSMKFVKILNSIPPSLLADNDATITSLLTNDPSQLDASIQAKIVKEGGK